jgi:transcriptional regulator with XRE-family HTH domain
MKSLKELREYNNLTQKEVAKHIGVSDRVYSYYEKGRTLPAKYVKPLANLFNISCDEFLENNTDTLDWEREFGCIERTERLELPTWEEISRDLQNVSVGTYIVREFDDYILFVLFRMSGKKEIYIRSTIGEEFWEFTKGNYTLACRKAKELFLGEKK